MRLQVGRHRGQVVRRNGRHHAGAEHEQNELAGEGRVDRLERRLQNDEAEYFVTLEVERQARLNLTFGNGFDTGADDFRGVGSQIHHHRGQGRGVSRPAQTQRGQRKKEKEQLHQKRRVADQLDIGIDQEAQGFGPGGFSPGTQDGHHQAHQHGQQRQLEGAPGAFDKQRPGCKDITELKCVVHWRGGGGGAGVDASAWITTVAGTKITEGLGSEVFLANTETGFRKV